uniref:palmitoyl-protein hydrolase n=2 Tax=Meloidogyne incognita group TaxID=654580 RepID=A0A915MYM5_MELJA
MNSTTTKTKSTSNKPNGPINEYITTTTVITNEPTSTTTTRMATTTVSTTSTSAPQVTPRATFRDLCSLFCCPPFPSSIVAKLAFMPPEPSYRILTSDTGRTSLELVENRTGSEWPHGQEELKNITVFFAKTSRRNKIACMFIKPVIPTRFTILFSHGNAVDIGQMCSFYVLLGYRLGCNVFAYDYSGYGQSTGRPSEKNLYADIAAALKALETKCQIPPERVILYGQSIGTVPSVDLASKNPRVAALILHSPLLSGMRVAFHGIQRTWCCDAFPSIEKIPRVSCPTLVIHGTEDDVVDFSHGVTIYEQCPTSVEPLWVSGAGHNDVEMHAAYLERLRAFIEGEVSSIREDHQHNKHENSEQKQRKNSRSASR